MTESFAELFEQSLADKQMQPGSIVQGLVVEIRQDAVVLAKAKNKPAALALAEYLKSAKAKAIINPLSMSDDEFLAQMSNRL